MRSTSLPRLLVNAAVSLAVLAGVSAPSAFAANQNRIQGNISNSSMAEIPNSVHPRVAMATDLGPVPGDTRLVGMSLRFTMTAAQQAALDQLLVDQQNPASPRYQQWLTPAQFSAQFGVSSGDIAKVTAWLSSQGFSVTGVANGGSFVTFDGDVAQAQAAFSTSIHNLSVNGEAHFANVTNASVPGVLANLVGDITGLHDFRAKPHVRTSTANPLFYSTISGSTYLAPGDLYTIYNISPLYAAGITGTGETIAVMGQVDISTADIAAFRSAAGLVAFNTTSPTLTTVHEGIDPGSPTCANQNCQPNDGDLAESSIDVEWSGAMAPNANILFVNGHDVMFNSLTQAIDQNLAPIVTLSYGECEAGWGQSDLNTLNAILKQANAQGQTVLSAAGDVGATDCDDGVTTASEGLTVNFPASSPYVTGLGGTQFTGGSSYFGTTTNTNGGSALSYVPESAWNEDALGDGLSSGGGGISNFFSKPAWQVETGPAGGPTTAVPPDGSRDVPDIALDAASAPGDTPYLFCYLGSCVNGFRTSSSTVTIAGGSSFDSQIFGGMLALVEQKIAARVGNANPKIYALGNNASYNNGNSTSVFHDVTTGSNKSPCTGGTPNCTSTAPIGYSAGPGYDLATGWGSLNVNNLANDWTAVTPLGLGSNGPNISTTTLSTNAVCSAPYTNQCVVAGATVTLNAVVSGSNGTPTGTVQFFVNNVAAAGTSTVTLTAGAASYSYVTSCASLGQQSLSAVYSGDATYQGSKGPALATGEAGNLGGAGIDSNGNVATTPLIVTVGSAGSTCPDFNVAPSGTGVTVSGGNGSLTVAAGGTIPGVTITVTPINSLTGTVSFSASVTSTSGYLPNILFSPSSVAVGPTSAGTTTMTLSGITADLHMPTRPGQSDTGTMLARQAPLRLPWKAAGSGIAVASMLLLTLPRRRRLGGLLLVALAVALIGGASGCSSSQTAAGTNTNPYAGTYIVTVTASYTASSGQVITHPAQVTYNIN